MKLTNMKLSAADLKERESPSVVSSEDVARYPWGLELNLDDKAMEKLKLEDLPAAEDVVTIMAKCKVTRVASTDYGEGKRQSMTMQITDMAIGGPSDKDEDLIWPGK